MIFLDFLWGDARVWNRGLLFGNKPADSKTKAFTIKLKKVQSIFSRKFQVVFEVYSFYITLWRLDKKKGHVKFWLESKCGRYQQRCLSERKSNKHETPPKPKKKFLRTTNKMSRVNTISIIILAKVDIKCKLLTGLMAEVRSKQSSFREEHGTNIYWFGPSEKMRGNAEQRKGKCKSAQSAHLPEVCFDWLLHDHFVGLLFQRTELELHLCL